MNTLKKLIDWRATLIAAVVSALGFWFVATALLGGVLKTPWLFTYMSAAIVSGEEILVSPFAFDGGVLVVGLLVHLVLALIFTVLVAFAIHRWGILVGVLGGAALGVTLYVINTFGLSYFFPWFYAFRSWMLLVSHIVFGALAGGVYELLEDESFDERYN